MRLATFLAENVEGLFSAEWVKCGRLVARLINLNQCFLLVQRIS
jgi:hypothetical protein